MYLVEEGRLRTFVVKDGTAEDIEYLRKGDVFGEGSMLLDGPRAATVEAMTACRLLALPRERARALLDEIPAFRARLEERAGHLDFRRVARVPLDFAEELLPADVEAPAAVGPEQVTTTSPARKRPRSSRAPPERPAGRGRGDFPTSTSSTRWTAAPPVSGWSHATTARPSPCR